MASKAPRANNMFAVVTWSMGLGNVSLRQTTINKPIKPSSKPNH
jgi:hypothetical protein